jgi:signal transduction histidine kinase/CheY-like chemotaxis protein
MTNEAMSLNRWFDVYAFRIGAIPERRIALIFSDVTDRKRAETDRQFLDQILQTKNAELERATEVAEKANLAKSDFLSSMSHELRTPLTAILGFAQLMETSKPPPTEPQKRSLDQIVKAGWYLLDLINEILDMAIIESGKLALTMETVSLSSLMLECQAMIEPLALKREIGVHFEKQGSDCFVHADRTRLKQAIINIMSNAVKYNTPGGKVQVTSKSVGGRRLRISVEDTGEGLSPEKIDQLFQPFNRLGQEINTEPGTGIGLVVTKQLVELMGGSIGVESTMGTGSVFWIELNLHDEHASQTDADADADADALPALDGEPGPGYSSTLLYVEDNAANLMLVEDIMARRPGIRLISARDGISGVALARSALPDMILMDVHLPGINGIDAMRILAHDPLTAHIPILALSANAMPQDIQNGLNAGFFKYLTKPIRVTELLETLDMTLAFTRAKLAQARELEVL